MEDELERLRKEVNKVERLEKEVEWLKELVSDEGDKVVIPEKSKETLNEKIDSLKRIFDQVMKGRSLMPLQVLGMLLHPKRNQELMIQINHLMRQLLKL